MCIRDRSSGEWKDYGLTITKREVSFNVYYRTSEFPVYRITKNLKPKNENEKYLIKNAQNRTINNSENLQNLIKKIIWKKFKLVNLIYRLWPNNLSNIINKLMKSK